MWKPKKKEYEEKRGPTLPRRDIKVFYSILESAMLLGMSYPVVETLIASGHLKSIKQGRRTCVPLASLDYYQRTRATAAAAAI